MKRNEVVGFETSQRLKNPDSKETQMSIAPQEALEVKIPKQTSARINPDSIPVLATAVALVGVLMVSSFIVSFTGLYDASEWTGLPEYFRWLPALFIDAAILAYTIALIVFKARGESVWRTVVALVGFASISVIANVAHTVSYWGGNLLDFRAWVGVAITASAPIAVLLAADEISRLAFKKRED
jgi:hypothetical protein